MLIFVVLFTGEPTAMRRLLVTVCALILLYAVPVSRKALCIKAHKRKLSTIRHLKTLTVACVF